MEINCLPFKEKQFLSGIQKCLKEKYGNEKRFVLEHRFQPDDLYVIDYVPILKRERDNVLIKKYVSEWFKEASVRGYFELRNSSCYVLTRAGLTKIEYYKNPLLFFSKEHWKWLVGTFLTFIAVVIAIIRLTRS